MIVSFFYSRFDVLHEAAFLREELAAFRALKWFGMGVSFEVFRVVPLLLELSAAAGELSHVNGVLPPCDWVHFVLHHPEVLLVEVLLVVVR